MTIIKNILVAVGIIFVIQIALYGVILGAISFTVMENLFTHTFLLLRATFATAVLVTALLIISDYEGFKNLD